MRKPKRTAGVDEAGRGPLAGPVVAAAVIFPESYTNSKITDSKKLSAKNRELLYTEIIANALNWSIVAVGHHRIDKLNIRQASLLAMSLALNRVNADFVLVDGNAKIPTDIPQETIIGGDSKILEISAASILAKVYRDKLMKILDKKYPGYELSKHSGYPTKAHREAVKKLGPSKIHRKTFKGVKEYII